MGAENTYRNADFTKEDLCIAIVEEFRLKALRDPEENDIYNSSKLAVALEYLGRLTSDKSKAYAAARDGLMIINSRRPAALSVRDLLALLPDEGDCRER